MPKAIVLVSGGLDSTLAAKYLEKHDFAILGIIFKSVFFSEESAVEMCKKNNIPYRVIDFSDDQIEIIKKPKYGYGKAMNPCTDCHLLMLTKAKEILEKEGYDIIATGEVVGQRPKSQNKNSLNIIAKKLGDKLFRPLSAKILGQTNKWIPDDQLLSIQGRGRKEQMKLAEEYGIKDYIPPAGGCVLTEPEYSKKLSLLNENNPDFDAEDAKILRYGKHYWKDKTQFVVSRNLEDGVKIKELARKGDMLIETVNIPAPLCLCRYHGKETPNYAKIEERGKEIIIERGSKIKRKEDVEFKTEHY